MGRMLLGAVEAAVVMGASDASAQGGNQPQQPMGFFITSVGLGDGGNLGGLAGADRHCQNLAAAVGGGSRTWRAYLSAAPAAGQPPVNARDRIGAGPWHNAKGVLIARDVTDLHGDIHRDRNSINKEFALNEKGEMVKGRGDTPNQHDILTGSDSHGRVLLGSAAILGGLVSFPLTVAASIFVGVAEAFFSFWASNFKEVLVFSLIIPVLVWRSLHAPAHAEEEE